ncbi:MULTISPECIES: tyrosine-type recombinase/integrase [unclassified Candidatus Paralachnospira]|uniref:tyrosine-type recombinase/integrase n=1 Tax=unclassified Candidatus Paralachnospira TaxID=3099471 RepID=UPI003F8FE876
MAEHYNMGVYQLENGNWAWRFTRTIDGKRVNRKGTKDADGNVLKSQKAAIRARQLAMIDFEAKLNEKPKHRMTVQEVYEEYCEHGRSGKAYTTIQKQDSLWRNHISERFGQRYIDGISVAEINDYLTELYYVEGRAYKYVEGFLKMFYLIFGQAYSRGYLELDTYNKLCMTKDVRIQMPKMKVDEETDIIAYDTEQVQKLDEYFMGTNAETAYMLGRYCGLRINECYGLKWCNVDLENGCIIIDRQMQYQNGLIKLVSLKTRNARRTVYMSQKLKEYFIELARRREADIKLYGAQREQNQTFIKDVDGSCLSSLQLVNTLPNGKIQTVNSMKYHSRTIKSALGIDFKFHHLRHTYGTRLAEMNTPTHILCNQMGHASGKVTERYYLAVSKSGIEILANNLNAL